MGPEAASDAAGDRVVDAVDVLERLPALADTILIFQTVDQLAWR